MENLSLLLPPMMWPWGSINNPWSFHCICQVLLDNILVSLNDNRRKGGWFWGCGGWFFVCLLVWLLVFLWNGVRKEGSFWNLGKFPIKYGRCGQVIFLTPDSVDFSRLSNLFESGSGRCLDARQEMLFFELNSSVELGWVSLGCCLSEFVWIRVVTPVSVQLKIDSLLIKLFNRSDYSKEKLFVFLAG